MWSTQTRHTAFGAIGESALPRKKIESDKTKVMVDNTCLSEGREREMPTSREANFATSNVIPYNWRAVYRHTSNIGHTLGNKPVEHSDVVGASPANYIFILDLTSGFFGLGKDNCRTIRETFMFWDTVRLMLEVWRYFPSL